MGWLSCLKNNNNQKSNVRPGISPKRLLYQSERESQMKKEIGIPLPLSDQEIPFKTHFLRDTKSDL